MTRAATEVMVHLVDNMPAKGPDATLSIEVDAEPEVPEFKLTRGRVGRAMHYDLAVPDVTLFGLAADAEEGLIHQGLADLVTAFNTQAPRAVFLQHERRHAQPVVVRDSP